MFQRTPRRQGGAQRSRAVRYYLPRLALSLLTLILLSGATWTVLSPSDGMTWLYSDGSIQAVDPTGPGGRAGLRPGDVVLSVNGHTLSLEPLYVGSHPGQQVVLTFQRGTEILDATLTLVTPTAIEVLWRLIPILVAAGFWVSSVTILVLRPRVAVCHAFFLLGQAATVMLSSGQLSTFNLVWAAYLFYLAVLALPPLLANLYKNLIDPVSPIIRAVPRWLSVLSLILTIPGLAALLVWGREETDPVFWRSAWSVWRTILLVYIGLTLTAIIFGVAHSYFSGNSADLRRRIRGLAFGTLVGFLPVLLFSLLPEVIWGIGIGLPYQATLLFLTVIPMSHAYVIVKHDLGPLDRLLNRSVVVFTLGLMWAGLYLGGVGIGLAVFRASPLVYPLVGMFVTAGMATVFFPLRKRVQLWIDRLFYGGWYDYRQVIARVSCTLSRTKTREELADCLVDLTVEGLRLQGAALYLRGAEGALVLERCIGLKRCPMLDWIHNGSTPPDLCCSGAQGAAGTNGHAAADLVSGSPECLPTQIPTTGRDIHLSLDPADPEMGDDVGWQIQLVHEGELLGLLLLGRKRDDDFLEPADVEILRTLADQASLASASVLLTHDLRQALMALEMAQRRTLASREEERRILAGNLHDGPIQDLVALTYHLSECREQAWFQEREFALALEDAQRESNRIMTVLRDVCSDLRSDVLDVMGLGPAMRQLACKLMEEREVVIYLDVPQRGPLLADPLGITLLRVFQEALSNAVEHAGVREVWTSFMLEDGRYELQIWDPGRGFSVPERLKTLALRGHFGLVTIEERIEAVNGHLQVHSMPGRGTRIRVWGEVDSVKQADDVHLEEEVSP